MLRFFPSFFAALAALASSGCDDPFEDQSCTLVACVNGANLSVARLGAWADGEHVLALQLGGRQHDCRFTLPLPPEAGPNEVSLAQQRLACTPALPSSPGASGAVVYRVDPPASGCPAPGDAGTTQTCDLDFYRVTMDIDDSAADVSLRLSLGDTVLLDEQRTLEYRTSYPNGPDCGGPCRFAALTFNVVEP